MRTGERACVSVCVCVCLCFNAHSLLLYILDFQPGRIFKIKKKTAILITLRKYNSHSVPIFFFKIPTFLNVDDLFKLQQYKLYFNYSHDNVPVYYQNCTLIPNYNVEKHGSRNKHELYT